MNLYFVSLLLIVQVSGAHVQQQQQQGDIEITDYYEKPYLDIYEETPFVETADDPNDVLYGYDDYGVYVDGYYDYEQYEDAEYGSYEGEESPVYLTKRDLIPVNPSTHQMDTSHHMAQQHIITIRYTDDDVQLFWMFFAGCLVMLVSLYTFAVATQHLRRRLTEYDEMVLKL